MTITPNNLVRYYPARGACRSRLTTARTSSFDSPNGHVVFLHGIAGYVSTDHCEVVGEDTAMEESLTIIAWLRRQPSDTVAAAIARLRERMEEA